MHVTVTNIILSPIDLWNRVKMISPGGQEKIRYLKTSENPTAKDLVKKYAKYAAGTQIINEAIQTSTLLLFIISYKYFAISIAVSVIRVEKPHSLSYQERTRTNLPSRIWVCAEAKVDEWGS